MKTKEKIEFGDFQTPDGLCAQVCQTLVQLGLRPTTVIEPTCGVGNFVRASRNAFPRARRIIGLEINSSYVDTIRNTLAQERYEGDIEIMNDDFFRFDWDGAVEKLNEPILFIGNPPWVTNSELCSVRSHNLPQKENFKGFPGFEALTGKSNFDVSEWMLIRLVKVLEGKKGAVAFLCKTSVARRVLSYFWKQGHALKEARMYLIDSKKHFNVSVDACLLVMELENVCTGYKITQNCLVFDSLQSVRSAISIGFIDGTIVSNLSDYEVLRHLRVSKNAGYKWRSGIKHDCSKIMELERLSCGGYINGLGQKVELEDTFLYPMLKSSDVGNHSVRLPRKYMLVTQRYVGECVEAIRKSSPKTWNYLTSNKYLLDARRSSIYKKNPPFSIFGVGDYAFSLWKVAISGFYKRTHFKIIRPYEGKPVMMDDTVYFLPCSNREEAELLAELLNSDTAQRFLRSLVFMDAKRPITVELLNKLSIESLLREFLRTHGASKTAALRRDATLHEFVLS